MNDDLIEEIMDLGFAPNIHGDAMDCGNYRIIEIDNAMSVICFTNPKTQVTDWRVDLSFDIPLPKLIKTLHAIIS